MDHFSNYEKTLLRETTHIAHEINKCIIIQQNQVTFCDKDEYEEIKGNFTHTTSFTVENLDNENSSRKKVKLSQNYSNKYKSEKMCNYIMENISTYSQCKNQELENEIEKSAQWSDFGEKEIMNILENMVKENNSGANNPKVYIYLKKLSLWKHHYKDREKEKEFFEIVKKYGKANKPLKKLSRFEDLFDRLPPGCYVTCSIPISYLTLIIKEDWNNLIKNLHSVDG